MRYKFYFKIKFWKKLILIRKRIHGVVQRHGCFFLLKSSVLAILALPVALSIIIISPVIKIRLIALYSSRIGGFFVNTYHLCCALESGDFIEEKNYKHFFYIQHSSPLSNKFALKMWSRKITILPCPQFWSFVDRILIALLRKKYVTPFKKIYEISIGKDGQNFFSGNKEKFLSFTQEEKLQADKLKGELGVPKGASFVCFLARDSKYLQNHFSHSDEWLYHEYRNVNIENYIPAMQYLLDKGIYVIRMGKDVEKKLEINHPKFIDYANHPLRSDFLDVYLSANCLFFVSTPSGLECIPPLFDRPLVTTNAVLFDLRFVVRGQPYVFAIPRNVINLDKNELLTYNEIYQNINYYFFDQAGIIDRRILLLNEWKKRKIALIENTHDEILSLIQEALDYVNGIYTETEQTKELKKLFWKNFPSRLITSQKSTVEEKMFISPSFLNKHADLLKEIL